MSILTDLVTQVRIESAWTPAVTIDKPFADKPASPLSAALGNFLKPVVIATVAGKEYRSAPYGEPGASNWPVVQLVGGAAVILALAWALDKALRK